jgi:tetratricopeptide (TPR) repeat protein
LTDGTYISAVRKCATALHAESVTDAARWPASDLLVVARRFESPDPILLARATLMHLEAARIVDGDAARAQRSAAFSIAMRLMALSGTSAPEGLRLNAVLATAASLHGSLDVVGVAVLLTRGLATWPQEPHLLLARGSLAETGLAMPGSSERTPQRLRDGEARAAAIAAVADYDAALLAAPGLVEARIRRGRLRDRLGRPAAAIDDLERASAEATDPSLAYLAKLFLGQAYEDAGRLQDADSAYEAAHSQMPDAQAPYLALAHLRTRQGLLSAASTVAIAMTGRTRSTVTDPWWIYDYGQFWDLDRRMTTLRDLAAR